MTYQVAVRLSLSPCVKDGQGNGVWETGSQKLALGIASVPALRSPTSRPSYTTITCMYKA